MGPPDDAIRGADADGRRTPSARYDLIFTMGAYPTSSFLVSPVRSKRISSASPVDRDDAPAPERLVVDQVAHGEALGRLLGLRAARAWLHRRRYTRPPDTAAEADAAPPPAAVPEGAAAVAALLPAAPAHAERPDAGRLDVLARESRRRSGSCGLCCVVP